MAIAYDAGFAYDLEGGTVRPFLSFTAGGVSYASSAPTETDFRLSLGAGVKLGGGAVRGRLEVVDSLTPDHFLAGRSEHDVHVRGGLSVRVP